MDLLLLDSTLNSSCITIDTKNNEVVSISNSLFGVVYVYFSYLFKKNVWKKQFFEISDNFIDIWDLDKKHKYCKTINNIEKVKVKSKIEITNVLNKDMYYFIFKKNYKKYIFASPNLEYIQQIFNKINSIIKEYK